MLRNSSDLLGILPGLQHASCTHLRLWTCRACSEVEERSFRLSLMASQDWPEREDSELRLSEVASGACSGMKVKELRLSGLAWQACSDLEGGEPPSSLMLTWSPFEETVDRLKKSGDSNPTCISTFGEGGGTGPSSSALVMWLLISSTDRISSSWGLWCTWGWGTGPRGC